MKNLKVVQVNTVYGTGSVGRITAGLYQVVKKAGGTPLVAYGRGSVPKGTDGVKIGNTQDFYCHVLRNFFRGESGFGSSKVTKQFIAWLKEEQPDLLHLHNIHGFYLQVALLFDYIKEANIPVVWTFHDCWAFTGHCAYFDYVSCEKWKTGCNRCRQHVTAYPYALLKDNSVNSYAAKKAAFTGVANMTIVTPSYWLSQLVAQSFLREYPIRVIFNGIDLMQFQPHLIEYPGILPDKKVVLGVANIWEKRKGLPYFEKLAEMLSKDYQIVLVGVKKKQKKELASKFPKEKLLALERTESTSELAGLYTRADVYVNTTLEDNFPTTNLEALACGTPVITFDTGGSGEALTKECGIVVPKGDCAALACAVKKMCTQNEKQGKPVAACLKQAACFDQKKRFGEYLALYQEIL